MLRSWVRKAVVWAGVKEARSRRSAPALKVLAWDEARIRARVVLLLSAFVGWEEEGRCCWASRREVHAACDSVWRVWRDVVRAERRDSERALRLRGEESVRIRMWPVCGAGMSVVVRRGVEGGGVVVE